MELLNGLLTLLHKTDFFLKKFVFLDLLEQELILLVTLLELGEFDLRVREFDHDFAVDDDIELVAEIICRHQDNVLGRRHHTCQPSWRGQTNHPDQLAKWQTYHN